MPLDHPACSNAENMDLARHYWSLTQVGRRSRTVAHSLGIEADEAAGAKTPDAWHVLRAQGHELEPIACSEKVSRDEIAEIEFAEIEFGVMTAPHALWQATPTAPGTVTCLWQYTPDSIATARENATALVQGLEIMPPKKKGPIKKGGRA